MYRGQPKGTIDHTVPSSLITALRSHEAMVGSLNRGSSRMLREIQQRKNRVRHACGSAAIQSRSVSDTKCAAIGSSRRNPHRYVRQCLVTLVEAGDSCGQRESECCPAWVPSHISGQAKRLSPGTEGQETRHTIADQACERAYAPNDRTGTAFEACTAAGYPDCALSVQQGVERQQWRKIPNPSEDSPSAL